MNSDSQAPDSSRPARGYLAGVQILRFLAALLVVIGHLGVEAAAVGEKRGQAFALFAPLDWGLGVDVFFVISGFIMFYLSHDKFEQKGAAGEFMRRRLVRIVPLYWICTTALLALAIAVPNQVAGGRPSLIETVASYLFIPWPRYDGQVFPILSLGWTLNYEMLFYVCFALALCVPRRIGLAALVALFWAFAIGAAFAPRDAWLIQFLGYPMVVEFPLGIGLAALYLRGIRLPTLVGIVAALLGIVIAVILYQQSAYLYTWRLVTGGVPAILLVGAVVLCAPPRQSTVTSALAFLGDASYSIYLTHPFAIKAVGLVWARTDLGIAAMIPVAVVLAVVLGALTHVVVERPLLRLLGSVRWTSGTRLAGREARGG